MWHNGFLWLLFLSYFSGLFEGASTFLTPKLSRAPAKNHYVPHFLKQWDINSYYVLLLYIIYVMESGRFSQSPAFFKRVGHNVEGFLLYVPLRRFYSVLYHLYVPLFWNPRKILSINTSVSTWQLSCIHIRCTHIIHI